MAVVLIVIFAIFLLFNKRFKKFQDVASLREQVEVLQKKVTVLNNLDEESLQQNVALTTSAVPLDKSLPTILSTMEGISDKTGVSLKSLIVDAPGAISTDSASAKQQQTTADKKTGAIALPYSVTLSGTFDQIKTFLAVSNKVRRLIRAKSFTLNFTDEQLTTQISFETFYAPLSKRNDAQVLQPLKNTDFDLLASLEEFPDMGQIAAGASGIPAAPIEVKENPFAL